QSNNLSNRYPVLLSDNLYNRSRGLPCGARVPHTPVRRKELFFWNTLEFPLHLFDDVDVHPRVVVDTLGLSDHLGVNRWSPLRVLCVGDFEEQVLHNPLVHQIEDELTTFAIRMDLANPQGSPLKEEDRALGVHSRHDSSLLWKWWSSESTNTNLTGCCFRHTG